MEENQNFNKNFDSVKQHDNDSETSKKTPWKTAILSTKTTESAQAEKILKHLQLSDNMQQLKRLIGFVEFFKLFSNFGQKNYRFLLPRKWNFSTFCIS